MLWIPVQGERQIPLGERIIGQPILWQPTPEQEWQLQRDWEELMELIVLGRLNEINARLGEVMQLRPKGRNNRSLANAVNAQGDAGFYASTVSNFEQYILAQFIQQGYFEKHINRMRALYQKKRNKLLTALKQGDLAQKLTIKEENAGLHFVAHFHTPLTEDEIIAYTAEKGVRLISLAHYYQNRSNAPQKAFVIGYSHLDDQGIDYAVQVLRQIL